MLVHVIDASSPHWQDQARVVDELINELGAGSTPRLEAFNKCDLFTAEIRPRGEGIVEISAKTGHGIDALKKKIEEGLSSARKKVTIRLPYDKAGLLEVVHREGAVKEQRYLEDGIELEAIISAGLYGKVKHWIVQ